MQATIDTMFVNEKIIGICSFCQFSPCNTRQMQLKRSIVAKTNQPPLTPYKIPHRAPQTILGKLDVSLNRVKKVDITI